MADINSEPLRRNLAPEPEAAASTREPDRRLITFVELLFFAYRDFTREADAVLADYGLGRAHHRVLHFVNCHPGMRVAALLDILKITKQSLARVLKELRDQGFIEQKAGQEDRRERLLYATPKGAALSGRLDALQSRRVGEALRAAGRGKDAIIARFMLAMIAEDERMRVAALLPRPVEAAAGRV